MVGLSNAGSGSRALPPSFRAFFAKGTRGLATILPFFGFPPPVFYNAKSDADTICAGL